MSVSLKLLHSDSKGYYAALGTHPDASLKGIREAFQARVAASADPASPEAISARAAFAVLGQQEARDAYDATCNIMRVDSGMGRAPRPTRLTVETIRRYIKLNVTGFTYYMKSEAHPEYALRCAQFAEEALWLETQARALQSAELLDLAASMNRPHSTSYCQSAGLPDRYAPLHHARALLEEAIAIEPSAVAYRLKLASMFVDIPQMRDIALARTMLEGPVLGTAPAAATRWLRVGIEKWEGNPTIDPDFRYEDLTINPCGEFFGERALCRAVVRKLKKEKRLSELPPVLDHLYRIAVLAEAAHAVGVVWYRSEKLSAKRAALIMQSVPLVRTMTYASHGHIKPPYESNPFLTVTDYKTFELVHGKSAASFDPVSLFKEVPIKPFVRK